MFSSLFRRSKPSTATRLYAAVVARSRHPALFGPNAMPDSFDGRFELLAMHLYLLHARLRDEGQAGKQLSQEVFDAFIDDMDAALREAAVGDQAVPKRINKMTRVYYGRAGVYDTVLGPEPAEEQQREQALTTILARNIFPDDEPEKNFMAASRLARYMAHEHTHLQQQAADVVMEHAGVFMGDPVLPSAADI